MVRKRKFYTFALNFSHIPEWISSISKATFKVSYRSSLDAHLADGQGVSGKWQQASGIYGLPPFGFFG